MKITRSIGVGFGLLFLAAVGAALAQDGLSADEIVKRSYEHHAFDFDSATAMMRMDLMEGSDTVESRTARLKALNTTQGGQKLRKVLLTFTEPADIAGTAFLSLENKGDTPDDQFLYMPSVGKPLRKGGKTGKGESFLGTQFTYGDMESKEVSRARHTRLPDESLNGIDCYVVESVPNNPADEKYSKYVSWINKSTFVPVRIQLFDLKGDSQKVMDSEKTEIVNGKDTITQMVMRNVQNNKSTRITITEINTKASLSPADFTKERMSTL